MKRKGISLVALVVTIIVLIILTGAVVATFMEGGIIDKAKEAVMKSDCVTLQEAYNIAYNSAKIDEVTGTGKEVNKIKILKDVVEDLSLKGFSFDVDNQEVEYTGDNKEIEEWINNNFKFSELAKSGYIFSTIDGKTYMTGLNMKLTFGDLVKETVGDILNLLGKEHEYSVINAKGETATNEERITTGCIIMKDGEEYATIVIKGDVSCQGLIDGTCYGVVSAIVGNGIEKSIEAGKTMAQILASDINNDGIISKDDINLVTSELENAQLVKILKTPTTIDELIYTWYSEADLMDKVKSKYTVTDNINISIESGTTYASLENDFKQIFGTDKLELIGSDDNSIIENGDFFEVIFPYVINEKEFCKDNYLCFIANVQ